MTQKHTTVLEAGFSNCPHLDWSSLLISFGSVSGYFGLFIFEAEPPSVPVKASPMVRKLQTASQLAWQQQSIKHDILLMRRWQFTSSQFFTMTVFRSSSKRPKGKRWKCHFDSSRTTSCVSRNCARKEVGKKYQSYLRLLYMTGIMI